MARAASASRRSAVRDRLFTPERLALPERIILTNESGRDSACGDHGGKGSVRNGGADRSEIHAQKAERCDRHSARHVWGLPLACESPISHVLQGRGLAVQIGTVAIAQCAAVAVAGSNPTEPYYNA